MYQLRNNRCNKAFLSQTVKLNKTNGKPNGGCLIETAAFCVAIAQSKKQRIILISPANL